MRRLGGGGWMVLEGIYTCDVCVRVKEFDGVIRHGYDDEFGRV